MTATQPSELMPELEPDITAAADSELTLAGPADNAALNSFVGEELQHALETLLFVACEPLRTDELARLLEASEQEVIAALDTLSTDYAERGLTLRRIAGGWQFVTPERFAFLVEKLYRPKFRELSVAAMETLAIIAYKQPITRAEISSIRQVESDGVVNTLLEKKLIREAGRVNAAGHAILYGTGEEFLRFFGLNNISDLPPLPEDSQLNSAALPDDLTL